MKRKGRLYYSSQDSKKVKKEALDSTSSSEGIQFPEIKGANSRQIMKVFGINFEIYNTTIDDKDELVDAALSKTIFRDKDLVQHFLSVIQDRAQEKVGETNSSIEFQLMDEEKSFNLILYYISSILRNKLKSDWFLEQKLINIFSTEEVKKFGFSNIEMCRSESKESINDLSKDLIKTIMLASRQSIKTMKMLFEKTGFIYPIQSPSLENVGNLYRLSLTSVIPSCLLYFLTGAKRHHLESINISTILSTIQNRQVAIKNLIEEKQQEYKARSLDDEKTNELQKELQELKNEFEIVERKISYLETFFPEFLRDLPISIENSWFCEKGKKHNGVSYFSVANTCEMKKLIYFCLVTSNYILQLVELMKSELDLSDINSSINGSLCLPKISLPEMNWFKYRFKQISENKRSAVFLTQIKGNEGWTDLNYIKQYKEYSSYLNELSLNNLVTNKDVNSISTQQTIVMSIAHPTTIDDEATFLYWLMSAAVALKPIHDDGKVHGDIKPDHILQKGDSKFCLIDFEFVVESDELIRGCTKGFHPPEYDDYPTTIPYSSISADIYSLALSGLYLLFDPSKHRELKQKEQEKEDENVDIDNKIENVDQFVNSNVRKIDINVERNKLAKLVEHIKNENLKSVLVKMLKRDRKERIKNASELIEELKNVCFIEEVHH